MTKFSQDHSQYSSFFFFHPERSDQEEGEQGSGGVGWEDRQGEHLEAGDCGEREPAEHGAGKHLYVINHVWFNLEIIYPPAQTCIPSAKV